MANASTSYSDWMRNNQDTVAQVSAQPQFTPAAPAVQVQAPAPAAAAAPSPVAAPAVQVPKPVGSSTPAFDQEEHVKAAKNDPNNPADTNGKSGALGKVLGIVGSFFGGPIGAALGAAAGMVGNSGDDAAAEAGTANPKRSATAQGIMSSFMGGR